MRDAVKGLCTHLASISQFQPEYDILRKSQVSKQKGGVVFFTRAPPDTASNPVPGYRGAEVNDRLEAIVSIFTLNMLFGVAGYQPLQQHVEAPATLQFKLKPYYADGFIERFPERRSCAQLAAAALQFREFRFENSSGSIFKPVSAKSSHLLGSKPIAKKGRRAQASGSAAISEAEAQGAASAAHFSVDEICALAGIPDDQERHPATKSLCWFAARIRKFASVELTDL